MQIDKPDLQEQKQKRRFSDFNPKNTFSPSMIIDDQMSPATQASNTISDMSPTKLKIHLKNKSKFVQEQFLKAN